MWRKYVMLGVAFAFGVILLTQSAWATDPTLTEEFKTEWQAAQDSLVGKWIKIMVYKGDDPQGNYWRHCELIIEDEEMEVNGVKGGKKIKRGKYVEPNGDTTQITGGWLGWCPGVAMDGYLETKEGDIIPVCAGGIIKLANGNNRMTLRLYIGTVDEFVLADLELDRQMFSIDTLTAQSVRNFLARHSVSEEAAFPNMTIDQP